MGIEPPYIGLYSICSMVGIEVRGMGILECGLGWSVGLLEWVVGGSGYFESGLQHSSAPESCATQPRRTVSDDCSYYIPRTPWAVIWDDIVCLTIRYHETDGSDAVNGSKQSLKPLHQDTDIWLHLLREIRYRSNSVRHGELSSP